MRRFLEKQRDKIKAVVFCTTSSVDTEIYKRYFTLKQLRPAIPGGYVFHSVLNIMIHVGLILSAFICSEAGCFLCTFLVINMRKKLHCQNFLQMLEMRMVRPL